MSDLTIRRSGELMVLEVQGQSDEGIEYVDAYVASEGKFVVVDVGRIVLPYSAEADFLDGAEKNSLTWEATTT